MGNNNTPGQTGSVPCPDCGNAVFFIFAGGPHQIPCMDCRRRILLEVVHDGKKWRTKVLGIAAR